VSKERGFWDVVPREGSKIFPLRLGVLVIVGAVEPRRTLVEVLLDDGRPRYRRRIDPDFLGPVGRTLYAEQAGDLRGEDIPEPASTSSCVWK
jgi:hypothetical protein